MGENTACQGQDGRARPLSIRFQADNDLKFAIVKAVRRREPAIDFASVQESGLDGLGDPDLLDRAASDGRVLVWHDLRTTRRGLGEAECFFSACYDFGRVL